MITLALRHRFPGGSLDIAFAVPTPGTTVLFGPSGAGKSSAVAAIAGLLRADSVHCSVDGVVLADTGHGVWTAPERRRIGMVFQDARLFAHLDVAANLRYGLRRAPPSGDVAAIGFDDIVGLLGLAGLLPRRPHSLSGGERQRVAIGRALLSQPRLLLMDEPLSGLDGAHKAEILAYLLRLRRAVRLPIVYVTHDLAELSQLADTVVLIEQGRVSAYGPLNTLSTRPGFALTARDDAAAILSLEVVGHDRERRLTRLGGDGLEIVVPSMDAALGQRVRVRVPAREVILAGSVPHAISVHNILPGSVRAMADDAGGHTMLVEVTVGGQALIARVTSDAVHLLHLIVGTSVFALVKSSSIEIIA